MKRRFFAMLLSLAMLFTLAPTAFAADNTATDGDQTETPELTNPATSGTSGGIAWKVEDGVLTISATSSVENTYTAGQMKDYTSPMGETVPEPTGWYALKDSIAEIKIEEGVTYLGDYAFSYLTKVVKVNIPASITSLGDSIFRGDTALTTVEWASGFNAPEIRDTDSNSDTYTGNYVPTSMFDGCTSLGSGEELSAWLPDSFTGVGCAAFRGTQFTVDFDDWDNLTYIGAYGFAGMPNLDSFTLSNEIKLGLRNGASNAFNGSGLKSLTVADGIAAIPNGMFNGCERLSSVTLADSITTIAMYAFRNTEALKEIDLKNVQTINGYAFQGSGLTALVLPESVKEVESRAFEACTSLTKVTINAAELTLDNNNTFAGCSSLSTVVTSADSKINGLNVGAFGPDNTDYAHYAQAPVENIEINGTVDTLNFSTLASLKDLTINGKNNLTSGALPSGFENLVINGNSWSVGHYQFQSGAHVKHLVVSANAVSPAVISDNATTKEAEAAFRSNSNLETAQFTGTTVKLQAKMFMGCTKLEWLDLSAVDTLTVGSGCFGDDTNSTYGASKENPNKFNKDCVIYAKDETAAQTLRGNGSGLDNTKGIVLVINGGSVDTTKTGFDAVYRAGYSATWYETPTGNAVTTPVAGKTYYANWTKSNSVALTSNPAAGADGKVSATYTPSGAVTLSVQNPGADWLYVWMKDNQPIDGNESSLTLSSPSESGEYTVKVMAGGTGTDVWTSNAINVTIAKAAGTASVSMDGWAYGETAKTPVPASATNGTENVTYQYKVENAEDSTYSPAVPTAAGSYTVKATFSATENYEEATATTNFTIAQATPTVSITAEPASLVGGGTVKLTVTTDAPAEVVPACEGVTVTKTGDGTFSALLPNETKTYTFTASYAGDDNHNNAKATCKVSVTHRSSGSSSGSSTTTTNSVSASTASNGKVSLDKSTAKKGDTVTVTVTPDAGYQLDKLTVTDKNGNVLKLTDKGNGKYSFTMPDGKVEIKAVFAKKVETSPFDDVSADAYYNQAVQWAQEKGITDGISSNLFGPKQPCTRSQIVTFLWRAAGSPEPKGTAAGMTDVVPGSYYAKAVAWAVENGITTGTAEGTFSPDATCTRAQAVTFLARAQNAKATGKTAFSDVPADSYFADAVAWAQANGVTTGTSETTFSPDNDCTRAQIVTFLYRANQGT